MAKGHVVIDAERCKGCELCVSVCPRDSLRMSEGFNAKGYRPAVWVNADGACTGCALCALVCPDTAIAVYREVVPRVAAANAARN